MRRVALGLMAVLSMATVISLTGQSGGTATAVNATRGVALAGYDVLAYFEDGKAVKGSPAFAHTWQGVSWHFATAARQAKFAAAPETFAPRFGGFCAYGVSRGYAVDIDPQAWAVEGGKLYLNYSTSVQRTWNQDRAGYISKAEAQWPAVAAKQSSK
jgi:hypothetical protein